ncbi:MAG TPA: hypothetical protein VMB27_15600 [Solirubrobacteraceae bacterium]|nr:hypothetical protein [Solirubrobacteraceae bacterium]
MGTTSPEANVTLADPVAEGRRVVEQARAGGIVLRLLGGVAVILQAPDAKPLLGRQINDIDLVTPKGSKRAVAELFQSLGYADDEVFNAFHGAHRQIYVDVGNQRKVDVFVGAFSMCHEIPIADRLDREPFTVPLAELLLTKLQIVELNERDERDIYNLCFHHELSSGGEPGIEGGLIAELCARDWGLWRTCKGTIERCRADLAGYDLAPHERELIDARLGRLWDAIEAAPKTSKWRWRAKVGERVRWYEEPEEEGQAD